MYQSLCEAVWVIPLAAAYDLIYESGLSEAEKTKIETKLFRPVAEGLRNMGIGGNWGSWHLSAVGVIGYSIKDKELIQYALDSFKSQIEKQLGDDGLWPESVHTYHFYPLNAFLYLAEAAFHNGTDLYNWQPKPGKSLKAMFTAPLSYAYPNFQLPAINDGWFKSFLPLNLYELAYARYGDPILGWVLKQGYESLKTPRTSLWALLHGRPLDKDFPKPKFSSINFPVLGIAILRSVSGNMITFDYGPHLGHGQPDKMGITLFANGKPLVLDYGTPGYGSKIMKWYVSTPAHNTVVVDGKNQAPTKERLLTCFETDDLFEVAQAETKEAYPGVFHRRTVIRVENYFIVIDNLESEQEHTYDWF
ncbi:MAG: alginate lyase family protein, partial [Armatimonadota bacterium]|nr:alginate lyase family protein [Armatimonadota bacterium]